MKKLLSVSILAMLAVAPLAANATDAYPDATIYNSGENNDTTKVASTAYVKDAYNAANTNINAERVRVDNINTKIGSMTGTAESHSKLYKNTNETIHQSLEALETAIDGLDTTAGNTYQTKADSNVTAGKKTEAGYTNVSDSKLTNGTGVADNLIALDKAIIANDSSISTLTSNTTVANGTYNYISQGAGVATNLVNLDTRAKTNADKIGSSALNNTGALAGNNNADLSTAVNALNAEIGATAMGTTQTTVTAAIAELNGGVNDSGSVLKKIKDNAESATFTTTNSTTNFVTTGTDEQKDNTIHKAVNRLDTEIVTLKTKVGASVADGNYIGKTGTSDTVSTALSTLDGQVKTNETNISTNAGDITTINNTIGTETMGTTATTLKGAIAEVNSKVLTVYSSWNSGGAASGDQTVALGVPTQAGSGTVGG